MDEMDDDIKFDKLLEDKRHKEISGLFKQLIAAVKSDDGKESELAKLIQKNNGNIDVFLSKLKEIGTPTIEAPNVTIDNNEISNQLKQVYDCQEKTNMLLQQLIDLRSADVEMIPTRGGYQGNGQINKVTVKTIIPKNEYLKN